MQQPRPATLVIEAWINPLSALTPSLILHNLQLQGIEVPQSLTIAVDRGHFDCTGTNYAVITVRTEAPFAPLHPTQQSFYCSFFSQNAVQGMDPTVLQQYWLGNCYLHVDKGAMSSFRHESGHVKTWRKIQDQAQDQAQDQDQDQDQDHQDAVSVDPICPKSKDANSKSNKLRIIQLQKKNFVLRTELDALKSEFRDLKAEVVAMKESLGTVKEDQVALAQRHKEQEAITKRANQCMQDWANKQIIERVWILETQHAQLRSEHLKQKEQRAHDAHQKAYEAHQKAHEEAQEAQKPNVCKMLKKKLKKELKQLSARLVLLENESSSNNNLNNLNNLNNSNCNKCCNNDQITNPFDFKSVYDHYDQCHYNDMLATATTYCGDECPALDLIQYYCADTDTDPKPEPEPEPMPALIAVPINEPTNEAINKPNDEDEDSDDDDFFEIHVEVVQVDGPK